MNYAVRILRRAQVDADEIFCWLHKRSPSGALRWYGAFQQAADDLMTEPRRFGLATESRRFSHEVREQFFKTPRGRRYRLLFTIIGLEVRILRIRGPGQRPVSRQDVSFS